jgi:phosphatidylserine/phosphatidylglycerophosphate/cardiolipin synthase-like enzyme
MHLPKSPWIRWGICLGIGLLLFVGISSQFHGTAVTPTAAPLPQDPYIQVYFNQNPAAVYTDPYRRISRQGDDLEAIIISTIDQATASIEVAVHELNLPAIAQALVERHQHGVEVKVVLENTYSTAIGSQSLATIARLDDHARGKAEDLYAFADLNHNGELSPAELAQRDALTILAQAQIPVLDDTADGSKGSGLMHHKFMVVDHHLILTGSTNWTLSGIHGDFTNPDSRGNANSLIVIDSAPLAQQFDAEFAMLWGDGPGGELDSQFGLQKPHRAARLVSLPGSTVEVQFSPLSKTQPWSQSVNGLIAKTLGQATQTVDMALFVFSEQDISNQLFHDANRGVQIKALIDGSFAYRNYSEALDMLGLTMPDHRCHYESPNFPWTTPLTTVGVPTLPSGDKLHHKFAVIDGQVVIVGSQNWSEAANTTNDENLLIIRNATVAAHFEREFDRLYSTADLGMTPHLQRTLDQHRRQCEG